MLLGAVMGMGLQSCSKDETIITPTDMTFDKELDVTQMDLIKFEVIIGDFGDTRRLFLFKNSSKAAHASYKIGSSTSSNVLIFKSWSLSGGKLKLTAEKNGVTETVEYSIKKMYKKLNDAQYQIQVILREGGEKYVFYAVEDGSNHAFAQEWWSIIEQSVN